MATKINYVTRRKYYLHSRVKKFLRFKVAGKTMYATQVTLNGLNKRQTYYINQLADNYKYVLQTEIA